MQNLPDWMIKEKEAAFDQYSEIGLAITKSPTWKDTDLKKMLTDFFNKDFENELPSFSDYETDSSIDSLSRARGFVAAICMAKL